MTLQEVGSCLFRCNREHEYSNYLAALYININGNSGVSYDDKQNTEPADSFANLSRRKRKFSYDSGETSGASNKSYTNYNGNIKYICYLGGE
jgi:hypothetical protein